MDPLAIVEGPINSMGECLGAPDLFTFDAALNLPGVPNVYMTMLLAQINPMIELIEILTLPPTDWLPRLQDFAVNFPSIVLAPFTASLNTLICSDGSSIPGLELPLPDIVPSGIDPAHWDSYDCSLFIQPIINLISCPFFLVKGLIIDPLLELQIPVPTFDLVVDIVLPIFELAFPGMDPLYLGDLVDCFSIAVLSVFEGMLS